MFIVIEGIDGSGKSTLAENLCNELKKLGKKAQKFSEPTNFETGKYIRKFLKGEIELSKLEQIQAFISDRELSVKNNILPNLKENYVVLDRYFFSTAAYQGSTEYSPEFILELNLNKKFPFPDLLFYLEINPSSALDRLKHRGGKLEIFESIQKLTEISENFQKILPNSTIRLNGLDKQEIILEKCITYILKHSK